MNRNASIPPLFFHCRPDNDLYSVLAGLGLDLPRYDTLRAALDAAPVGAGILSLADDYPRPGLAFDQERADRAAAKDARLYLEYPSALPGLRLSPPRLARWERVVVSTDRFAALDPGTLLAQHGCWYTPIESVPAAGIAPAGADSTLLCVARVAGYDRAIYGLPQDAHPLLFEWPGSRMLVATSKLSQFVRGRYAPRRAWQALWEGLLAWLAPGLDLPALTWTPTVRLQAGPQTPLGDDAEASAYARSVDWFRAHAVYSIDRKKGAIEGFESAIDARGRQMRRTWVRGDCCAETAMVFAQHGFITRDPDSRQLAAEMLDTVLSPDFFHEDPSSPAYGLNNWYERGPVFYGDDNARVILAALAARPLLGEKRWDERVQRCLLANLRTTGLYGFRRNRIDLEPLLEHGWRFYAEEAVVSIAPHYQAYLWAAFLLGYLLTGFEGFFRKPKNAIRMTMDAYPNWRWTNGFTQEWARMLLPLAFLVRTEDTAEHRGWLMRVADDLLAQMQPSGAIYERLGPLENGQYAPPQSNEEYGTTEASLIQANGDPACDLLYTANYALLGLHEAAAATGDERLAEAETRLARFLCRIQARSEVHPWLDGAWMRSFDDRQWEYWGSSADAGWGAWCVESGWTNTWIASVLALRMQGTTLFELATGEGMAGGFPALREEMLGAGPLPGLA